MNCHIRWLIRRDLPEVLNIELDTSSDPLTEKELARILKKSKPNTIGMVAEHNDIILGFMIYELHPCYINVIRFAVDHYHQRMGIGTQMLNKLKEKLSHDKRRELKFHVHEDFLKSHLFLKKHEFVGQINKKNREIYDFNFGVEEECPV